MTARIVRGSVMRAIPFSQCDFRPAPYAKRGHAGTVFSAAGIESGVAAAAVCADQDRFSMTDLRIEIARQSSPELLRAVTAPLTQLPASGRASTGLALVALR